jgi:hypothetical protein
MRRALGLKPREKITAARLAQALRGKAERESLRDCYDEIIAGGARRLHNRVPMSLYSGPTGRVNGKSWEMDVLAGGSFRVSSRTSTNTVAWIGTGDATLNIRRIRTACQAFYRPLQRQILTLLLPHHGSRHNFHPELLNGAKLCVASAGKPSPYKHPSRSVIEEIRRQRANFWHVSQRDGSGLVEFIRAV